MASHEIYTAEFDDQNHAARRKLVFIMSPLGTSGFISSLKPESKGYNRLSEGDLEKLYSYFDSGDFQCYVGHTEEAKEAIHNLSHMPHSHLESISLEIAERLEIALSNCGRGK